MAPSWEAASFLLRLSLSSSECAVGLLLGESAGCVLEKEPNAASPEPWPRLTGGLELAASKEARAASLPWGCGEKSDEREDASEPLVEEPNGFGADLLEGWARCLFREAARMVVLLSTLALFGAMVVADT